MDWDEISNLYRDPSIDDSYQVLFHLAKRFQRRRLKCEKLTNYGQQTPSDGKISTCQRANNNNNNNKNGVVVTPKWNNIVLSQN
jgi:hypothetical protein